MSISINRSVYNRCDGFVLQQIRDFVYGDMQNRHVEILEEIKELNSIPTCGEKCVFRPRLGNKTIRKARTTFRTESPWRCYCGEAIPRNLGDTVEWCVYCVKPEDPDFEAYHHTCN